MVDNIADFDYIITLSERDALALEANLIKKHKPHYNILLKDDKAFPVYPHKRERGLSGDRDHAAGAAGRRQIFRAVLQRHLGARRGGHRTQRVPAAQLRRPAQKQGAGMPKLPHQSVPCAVHRPRDERRVCPGGGGGRQFSLRPRRRARTGDRAQDERGGGRGGFRARHLLPRQAQHAQTHERAHAGRP